MFAWEQGHCNDPRLPLRFRCAGHHARRRACCWPEPHSRRLRVSRSFRSHSERSIAGGSRVQGGRRAAPDRCLSSMGVWMLRSARRMFRLHSRLRWTRTSEEAQRRFRPARLVLRPTPTRRMVEFRGRVVNPEGKPLAGAKIYLDYFVWAEYRSGAPPRLSATSDAEAAFDSTSPNRTSHRPVVLEPWRWTPPCSPWRRATEWASPTLKSRIRRRAHDLACPATMRLWPGDWSISKAGQWGATVRVTAIAAPPGGNLTPFIAAGRDSR